MLIFSEKENKYVGRYFIEEELDCILSKYIALYKGELKIVCGEKEKQILNTIYPPTPDRYKIFDIIVKGEK